MSKKNTTAVNNQYTSSTQASTYNYVTTTLPPTTFNYDVEVKKLLDYLKKRKNMEVRTSTLYDKFEEVTSTYTKEDYEYLTSLSDKLWKPSNIKDFDLTIHEIQMLKPVIIPIPKSDKNQIKEWVHLCRMISTMSYSKGVGRNIKFYVKDEVTNKVLGLVELSSDFGSLGVRDSFIGWSHTNRFNDRKLGHTAVGSTIVSVQPFGHNFLGGKLMSMLLTSKVVRDEWFNTYQQDLYGITTTSLYGNEGKETQYDGMKQWTRLGETTGQTLIKPKHKVYTFWTKWLKNHFPNEYKKAIESSGPKQRIIHLLLTKLGLKSNQFQHGYKRGVYFSKFFSRTFDLLKGETTEVGEELFDSSVDSLVKSWKKRAIKRYKSLFKKDEVISTGTYYSSILDLTWEQTLYKYMGIKTISSHLKQKLFAARSNKRETIVKVSFISIRSAARLILQPLFAKVKTVNVIYFLFLNIRLVQTMYFKSFIRNSSNDVL
jgi:hypothetical protein